MINTKLLFLIFKLVTVVHFEIKVSEGVPLCNKGLTGRHLDSITIYHVTTSIPDIAVFCLKLYTVY